jgi:DNA modification methylase
MVIYQQITLDGKIINPVALTLDEKRERKIIIMRKKIPTKDRPEIFVESYELFMKRIADHSVDVLITDPPYMTDVQNITEFVKWIWVVLPKLKTTSQAYIFTGPYPQELQAYLNILLAQSEFEVTNILVWTYRNTIGPSPKCKYRTNWNAIFYMRGPNAPVINTESLLEKFGVKDISAPDGRQANNFYKWQKPEALADQIIRHATTRGNLVIDPFAGSGTFLLKAAEYGCLAKGCEIDPKVVEIAIKRGCVKGV